ncbi:aminotransferase class IV [Lachnospiraceae bacterium 54-53]
MEALGYYNGAYGPLDEMMVPMNDRACYFGDGVYDATYCANHVIYAMDQHIDRFFSSAHLLKMEVPMTKEELKAELNGMAEKVEGEQLMVYWQLTRGTARRSHAFPDGKANLWIIIRPFALRDLSLRMKLITYRDTRYEHCNIKTLNLIPNVMAAQAFEEAGCDEAVFYRGGGIVTECAHSNISIIKDGILYTHPADRYILPGIARIHLIAKCGELGLPVSETAFTVDEMMKADEIIVTSSGTFCSAVSVIDGIPVGGKAEELIEKLQKALTEAFHKETGTA